MPLNVKAGETRIVRFNNAEEANRWFRDNEDAEILDVRYGITSDDGSKLEGLLVIYKDNH
ncbi:hypothetical protein [Bacillus marinisedimentorum]|uniref:hypothetical protein n=1 Tax=Bacillus marinisedimentorum TaxID=1821260 RepID=UPI0007DEC865|nr:hypothetical protein [Bacillus marinisedimentorum]